MPTWSHVATAPRPLVCRSATTTAPSPSSDAFALSSSWPRSAVRHDRWLGCKAGGQKPALAQARGSSAGGVPCLTCVEHSFAAARSTRPMVCAPLVDAAAEPSPGPAAPAHSRSAQARASSAGRLAAGSASALTCTTQRGAPPESWAWNHSSYHTMGHHRTPTSAGGCCGVSCTSRCGHRVQGRYLARQAQGPRQVLSSPAHGQ